MQQAIIMHLFGLLFGYVLLSKFANLINTATARFFAKIIVGPNKRCSRVQLTKKISFRAFVTHLDRSPTHPSAARRARHFNCAVCFVAT